MQLTLSRLPSNLRGIYEGKVPNWARYLYPDAAESLLDLEEETGGLIYTSLWRSANASLWAIKNKSGAMPPGFSAHNYGLAVDLTVDQIIKEKIISSYDYLLNMMAEFGWYCHRRDRKKKFESWHFNYLGHNAEAYLELATTRSKTWHLPIEERIKELYGYVWEEWEAEDVQRALRTLKFYDQKVDGLWGSYSRGALNSFQRAYKLRQTSKATDRDIRTLAFCTAKKALVLV